MDMFLWMISIFKVRCYYVFTAKSKYDAIPLYIKEKIRGTDIKGRSISLHLEDLSGWLDHLA